MRLKKDRFGTVLEYDEVMETRKWSLDIPFIKLKETWEIKIMPPALGAIIRFLIKNGGKKVSVYLDGYDMLGSVGKPYWELFSMQTQETVRFGVDETARLLEAIDREIYIKELDNV